MKLSAALKYPNSASMPLIFDPAAGRAVLQVGALDYNVSFAVLGGFYYLSFVSLMSETAWQSLPLNMSSHSPVIPFLSRIATADLKDAGDDRPYRPSLIMTERSHAPLCNRSHDLGRHSLPFQKVSGPCLIYRSSRSLSTMSAPPAIRPQRRRSGRPRRSPWLGSARTPIVNPGIAPAGSTRWLIR
jgi:hypothetical protein